MPESVSRHQLTLTCVPASPYSKVSTPYHCLYIWTIRHDQRKSHDNVRKAFTSSQHYVQSSQMSSASFLSLWVPEISLMPQEVSPIHWDEHTSHFPEVYSCKYTLLHLPCSQFSYALKTMNLTPLGLVYQQSFFFFFWILLHPLSLISIPYQHGYLNLWGKSKQWSLDHRPQRTLTSCSFIFQHVTSVFVASKCYWSKVSGALQRARSIIYLARESQTPIRLQDMTLGNLCSEMCLCPTNQSTFCCSVMLLRVSWHHWPWPSMTSAESTLSQDFNIFSPSSQLGDPRSSLMALGILDLESKLGEF